MQRITLRRKRSGEHNGVPRHPQAERGLSAHRQWGATRNERIDALGSLLDRNSVLYHFPTVTVKLVNVINCQMWSRRSVLGAARTVATRARLDSRVSRRLVPSRVLSPPHTLYFALIMSSNNIKVICRCVVTHPFQSLVIF